MYEGRLKVILLLQASSHDIEPPFRGEGGVHKQCLQDLAFFFDHLPPSVYIFYGIKVYKESIFDHLPPPLVNVVCERPFL